MKKEIPPQLKSMYSHEYEISYIGRYHNADAFQVCIPNAKTGFPDVCLVREKGISQVTGFDALDIIEKLIGTEK